jgi:hypothetical protein
MPRRWFASIGASRILLSVQDLSFLFQHDPQGVIHSAIERLAAWKESGCREEVYNDERASVLRVPCR